MSRALLFFLFISGLLSAQATPPVPQNPNQSSSQLPLVNSMDVLHYPPLARAANVQGIVQLEVITDGQNVIAVRVLSGARLLAEAAEKNVRSWKFYPTVPTTNFTVSFNFKFATSKAKNYKKLIAIWPNAEIRMELPSTVEITCAPPPSVDASPNVR